MSNDYSGVAASLGIGFFIIGLLIYLAILALVLWVSYLIMRTAVKNGVILAMRETGQQFAPVQRPGYPPAAPPYPGAPGPATPSS